MKPILFNTEMVRAILDGRKSVTRRIIKPQPLNAHTFMDFDEENNTMYFLCGEIQDGVCRDFGYEAKVPYRIGDILYVRETWQYVYDLDVCENILDGTGKYVYAADGFNPYNTWIGGDGVKRDHMPWRPSIHMPKEAARIFLRVTDIGMERLQYITPEQCVIEGLQKKTLDEIGSEFMRGMFSDLWDSTIKKADIDRYGWNANPWVYVIEFERISKEEAYDEF